MAIPSNFNSLELSTPLPSNFSKWFRIWGMVGTKYLATIPEKYTPLDTIAIGEDISYNIDVQPTAQRTAIEGLLVGQMLNLWNLSRDLSKAQGINLSRSQSLDTSPRFGYQIGSLKHQAYFKIRSFAGSYNGLMGTELSDFTSISSIEYATNSRFKKLYLSHGKILNIRKEYDNIYYVNICNFNTNPDMNFSPSGTLKVWSVITKDKEKKYQEFTFDLKKSQINNNGELIFDKNIFPDIEKMSVNDFFTIDKPWILEDYSLLFEFGLNNNSGFYTTNEQKYVTSSAIQGIWIQESKDLTYSDGLKETVLLWTLYTDLEKTRFILPITPEQEKSTGESSEIGGTLQEGINIAIDYIKDAKISSVRVVIFGSNSYLQNFYPPTLIGEFVKAGNYYFEIVGHPRTDTVEVNLTSSNGFLNFIEVGGTSTTGLTNVEVFQQNFWFINELYYNYPYSEGLWQSDVKTVKVNNYKKEITEKSVDGKKTTTQTDTWINPNGKKVVESKIISISSSKILKQDSKISTIESKTTNILLSSNDVIATFLGADEKGKTSCNYLTERFYKSYSSLKFDNNGFLTTGFYKKYKNWYFFNPGNKKTYKILDAAFDNSKSTDVNSVVDIKLTLDGDVSSEITVGLTFTYIFLGEPHTTYSGKHGEMSLSLNLAKSLDTKQWYAYMYGNYYSGTYVLSAPASQIYINSFAYGDNVMLNGRDIADILVSIPAATSFLSGMSEKIGKATREYLFFIEPENNCLVYRSGSCAWQFEPQKKLVVTMEPQNNLNQTELKESQNIIIKIIYNTNEENSGYWFVLPKTLQKKAMSSYESYYVSKSSHVNTDLTRLYNLESYQLPNEIRFPLEFYSSNKFLDEKTSENTVVVDTYFASNLLNSGEGLEKIYGSGINTKNKLTSLLNGHAPDRGQFSNDIKSIYYVNHSKILKNVNYLWAYSAGSARFYIFYNYSPPDFYIKDIGGNSKASNPSMPSVFVLSSDDSGDNFYSPTVTEENKSSGTIPLMLLYDFDLRGSVINKQETTCFLFGFAYERGLGPKDKDKNGDPIEDYQKNLFLAMYSFNLNNVFKQDDTYLISSKDGETTWIARFPKFTSVSDKYVNIFDYEYGINKDLYGHKLQEVDDGILEDYNEQNENTNESAQCMVSILNQHDATFQADQISATIDSTGTITLFIKVQNLAYNDLKMNKKTVSGIICLTSKNNGITWIINTDSDKNPIVYNDNDFQKNPYQLGDLLFLIDGKTNKLIVKNIKTGTTNIVCQNVFSQKIYATMKENGSIYAYYYGMGGNISASLSNDGGVTWKYLNNW